MTENYKNLFEFRHLKNQNDIYIFMYQLFDLIKNFSSIEQITNFESEIMDSFDENVKKLSFESILKLSSSFLKIMKSENIISFIQNYTSQSLFYKAEEKEFFNMLLPLFHKRFLDLIVEDGKNGIEKTMKKNIQNFLNQIFFCLNEKISSMYYEDRKKIVDTIRNSSTTNNYVIENKQIKTGVGKNLSSKYELDQIFSAQTLEKLKTAETDKDIILIFSQDKIHKTIKFTKKVSIGTSGLNQLSQILGKSPKQVDDMLQVSKYIFFLLNQPNANNFLHDLYHLVYKFKIHKEYFNHFIFDIVERIFDIMKNADLENIKTIQLKYLSQNLQNIFPELEQYEKFSELKNLIQESFKNSNSYNQPKHDIEYMTKPIFIQVEESEIKTLMEKLGFDKKIVDEFLIYLKGKDLDEIGSWISSFSKKYSLLINENLKSPIDDFNQISHLYDKVIQYLNIKKGNEIYFR